METFTAQRNRGTRSIETNKGKAITAPDMAINPTEALKKYASGTLQRNMNDFYDSNFPDFQVPDVSRLSQLEKLQLQAQYREDVLSLKAKAIGERVKDETAKPTEQPVTNQI